MKFRILVYIVLFGGIAFGLWRTREVPAAVTIYPAQSVESGPVTRCNSMALPIDAMGGPSVRRTQKYYRRVEYDELASAPVGTIVVADSGVVWQCLDRWDLKK